jgi:hypothetical protein
MHQLPIEQQVLLIAQLAAIVALCIRLWASGLHRIYVHFFSYLVFEFFQTLIPFIVPVQSLLYRDLFVGTQALLIILYALIVLELYSVILRDLEGVAGVARRYIKIALAFAAVLSLLPLRLEKLPNTPTGYLYIFERPVFSTLVAFLLLISGFLVYYPVPLGRNALAYLAGYAVFFSTVTATAFMNNMGYSWNRLIGNIQMVVAVSCLIFWLLALTRKGENKQVVVGHQWNPGDEQRLLAQLQAINSSLLPPAGK